MAATRSDANASESALSSVSAMHAPSAEAPQPKSSSVRFTPGTNSPLQSAKASRRTVAASDETTPIRQSDGNDQRTYNTSNNTLPLPSPQPVVTASSSSQETGSSTMLKGDNGPPWYKKIADKYGSVMLENKASVARDHLALERTFLAWLRTSLSFASIGIAITQLFRLNSSMSHKTPTDQSFTAMSGDSPASSQLPFSPFVGHTIPAEVLPYLQYMAMSSISGNARPKLGPTLLDQLLLLTSEGTSVNNNNPFSTTQLDADTSQKLRRVGKPLGATFIGISVVVLLVGAKRYFDAQHWIMQGRFPASRASITLVAFVAFALIVASLVVVIVISPTSYEK